MRNLYVFNMLSLDGFFEGPDHDISWHNVDQEFNEFAIQQLEATGALLFGRVTYQLMADYWPTSQAVDDDPIVASKMNSLPKFVFSKSLHQVEWNNTRLLSGGLGAEVLRLKQGAGPDLAIFGSGQIVSALAPTGLIDEYRLIINPLILGRGTPLFQDLRAAMKLKLLSSRIFNSGNVLLTYSAKEGIHSAGRQDIS